MLNGLQLFQGDEHQPFLLSGGAPAALLVHGFPGTPAEMRPLADALHAEGWTVEGLLLPGFGPQIETLGERRLEDWTGAVSAALSALQRSHRPVILAGLSMGAAVSLAVAANNRPPDRLLLFAPFIRVEHPLWDALPALRHVFRQFRPFNLVKLDFSAPETREGIQNFMPDLDLDDPAVQAEIRRFSIPTEVLHQIYRAGRQARQAAPSVTVPTRIVHGRRDKLASPEIARQLAARLPSAEYHEVDAEHTILDAQASAWPQVRTLALEFARSAAIGMRT